jgi:hypothetical protein
VRQILVAVVEEMEALAQEVLEVQVLSLFVILVSLNGLVVELLLAQVIMSYTNSQQPEHLVSRHLLG